MSTSWPRYFRGDIALQRRKSYGWFCMSLFFYRIGNFCVSNSIPLIPRICTLAGRLLFGAYIPSESKIGTGCKVAYGGAGVVIHKRATIGNNCLISPGVVIGGRGGSPVLPTIGENVSLFPGAKVLGPVVVGDFAQIGANAVVVHDVEPGGRVVAGKAIYLN